MNINIAITSLPDFNNLFAKNEGMRLILCGNSSFATEVVLYMKLGKNEVHIDCHIP
jgi:hypothetical protein